MLYQNFVAQQLHPSRFEVPYMKRNAILRQLEMKEEELKRSKTKLNTQEVHLDKLKELRSANILNDENIDNMLRLRDIILTLPDIENEWKRLTREFSSLDFTYLKQIDKALADVENEINFINSQIRQMEKSIGRFDEAKEEKEQRIPEIKKQIEERQIFIMGKYPFDWIEKIGEPRFLQEMEKRQDSKQIFTSFGHAVKSTQTRMDKKWKDLLEERINYNQEFAGAFNIQALDNEAYAEEKNKLENTHLVDYERRSGTLRKRLKYNLKRILLVN